MLRRFGPMPDPKAEELKVLKSLAEGEGFGFNEIGHRLREVGTGMGNTTLSRTLKRLEDKGYVVKEIAKTSQKLPKNLYRITELGNTFLQKHSTEVLLLRRKERGHKFHSPELYFDVIEPKLAEVFANAFEEIADTLPKLKNPYDLHDFLHEIFVDHRLCASIRFYKELSKRQPYKEIACIWLEYLQLIRSVEECLEENYWRNKVRSYLKIQSSDSSSLASELVDKSIEGDSSATMILKEMKERISKAELKDQLTHGIAKLNQFKPLLLR
ncbi:MAG: helix-turn-helix transcriptional regulator [Nitrososphaerales archaeon]